MVEWMQQGAIIMSQVYCKMIKKLHRTIQNKRCGMLTYGVVLLHDNVRPHTAAHTRALLEHFNWELFDHPPYRPDLTSYLKNWFTSRCFNNIDKFTEGVKTWLGSQEADFFHRDIQKLIPQYEKCLNSSSGYTEKQLKYIHIFSAIKFFFSLLLLLTAHWRLLSK
jgi:hypothetical protein